MAHEDLVSDKLNPAVGEKAREAVLLATTVLGMSRTDVVDTYNHLARQHGVAVGTELDSSKVWLKMYRGVVSTIGFDQGVERIEFKENETPTTRAKLADNDDVSIIRQHMGGGDVKKLASAKTSAKRIEKNANERVTGYAGDSWESALGEIVANVAMGEGADYKTAIAAVKLRHNDLKEVGKFIPEASLTHGDGPATLIENVTVPITSGNAEVVNEVPGGRQRAADEEGISVDDFGASHSLYTAKDGGVEEDEKQGVEEDGPDLKKAALAEALQPFLADKLSDRDYAGFLFLAENADDYLDRKLQTVRRGEGVETHEVRAGDIFGAGERTRPEFIERLQAAIGYGDHKDAASARKFLSRLEEKIQKWTNELEAILDKGIQPPLTEKAQERMNMGLQDLSRQIQR